MFWRVMFWRVMFSKALGGSCLRLLSLLFLIASDLLILPVSLSAQSDSAPSGHDFSIPLLPPPVLPPHVPSPPITQPPASPLRPSGAPPKSAPLSPKATFGFVDLTRAAGKIFSGTVTAISPNPSTSQGLETVSITFHIDQAIRGVVTGQDLTISQWMGAWSSGQRYRLREHLLLFLYPPSKLGLTSCVGGDLGRFTFDSVGRILLSARHRSAFRADPILSSKSHATFSEFALAVDLARSRAEERE
jgi:hypothetical protein